MCSSICIYEAHDSAEQLPAVEVYICSNVRSLELKLLYFALHFIEMFLAEKLFAGQDLSCSFHMLIAATF